MLPLSYFSWLFGWLICSSFSEIHLSVLDPILFLCSHHARQKKPLIDFVGIILWGCSPVAVMTHLKCDHSYCLRLQPSFDALLKATWEGHFRARGTVPGQRPPAWNVALVGISDPPITVFVSLTVLKVLGNPSWEFSELQEKWRAWESRWVPCYLAVMLRWVHFFVPSIWNLPLCF